MLGFEMNVAKMAWTVFLVFFLLFITYLIRDTIIITAYAIFFSYLVYPMVQVAERYSPKQVSRTMSIILVFLFVGIFTLTLGTLFGTKIFEEAKRLGEQFPEIVKKGNVIEHIWLPSFMEPLRNRALGLIQEFITPTSDMAFPFFQKIGSSMMYAMSNLIYVFLVPIISFLIIKEAPSFRTIVLSLMGKDHRKLWGGIVEDLDVLLAKYVRALLLLSLATFISYGVVFALMGVPYSFLLAATAAILEFIPFIGPLTAVIIIVGISVATGFPYPFGLIIFFIIYRLFQDYILNPYLMSEGVHISPLLVILGLLAGEQLGGIAGIFLSVPIIAAAKIIFIRVRAADRALDHSPA